MGAGSATQRIDREGPGGAFPVVEPDSWGREGALGPAREAGSAARGRGSEWRSQKKGNRAPNAEGSGEFSTCTALLSSGAYKCS